jgi:hypothetical protein
LIEFAAGSLSDATGEISVFQGVRWHGSGLILSRKGGEAGGVACITPVFIIMALQLLVGGTFLDSLKDWLRGRLLRICDRAWRTGMRGEGKKFLGEEENKTPKRSQNVWHRSDKIKKWLGPIQMKKR